MRRVKVFDDYDKSKLDFIGFFHSFGQDGEGSYALVEKADGTICQTAVEFMKFVDECPTTKDRKLSDLHEHHTRSL